MQTSRRSILQTAVAGLASLGLTQLLRRRSEAAVNAASTERTALIVVWLPGGASHLETYDPKPSAPSEFRGPYSSIATSAPGMELCELLPHHARVADRFSILRSMVHTGFCHQQGTQQLLTGHPVRELKQKPDDPDLLAIANSLRHNSTRKLPIQVHRVSMSARL